MNLENVTVEMRPRGEWEAADLGARMIRRDAVTIYKIWFSVTLPMLFIAMALVAFGPWPTLASFLYWWLEPIADGPILRVISRRLFGESANTKAALRETLRLAWQNKLFWLTPYRLHFARSIAMPITQLEGLSGEARRMRAKVLNLRIQNHGTGVTIAYQHLAGALYIGIILFGFLLVPTAYQDSWGESWVDRFWADDSRMAAALSLLAVYAAQSALQPWFVGAGFGLYINCRTQLEAWDIEVAFRRMVQRRRNGLAPLVVLLFCALPLLASVTPAGAQEMSDAEVPSSDPGFAGYWSDDIVQPALEVIGNDERLNTTEEVSEWQSLTSKENEPAADHEPGWWSEAARNIGEFIAFVIEFGLWIVVALLLAIAIATSKHWLPYLQMPESKESSTRRIQLSMGDITAESLPADIPSTVTKLWKAGKARDALSLLYRGSVFAAVNRHGVRLPMSATEGACLTSVERQTDEAQASFFRDVVNSWILCAYGSRIPPNDTVLGLVEEWPQHYGESA